MHGNADLGAGFRHGRTMGQFAAPFHRHDDASESIGEFVFCSVGLADFECVVDPDSMRTL